MNSRSGTQPAAGGRHGGRAHGVYELLVEAQFAAAHRLREYQGKCEALHGHNWRVLARLQSTRLDRIGMVMDFKDVKRLLTEILDELDHHYINEDVAHFATANPTTENLARYIFGRLAERLPEPVRPAEVTVWESDRCGATYREL